MNPQKITKIAIMAVGGQGGGVLTSWIETLARSQGYVCQATSVAGVAQRTGATIYYIEMAPKSEKEPVFALAPSSGDVDILIAAEMMEVGRAIQRGFVTPDRTLLIGSSHRALAVSEKMVPGDGIADADQVIAAAEIAAKELILADMEQLAVSNGSVISSTLFGALCGSKALPFNREDFEGAIRSNGKAISASLRAFEVGFQAAKSPSQEQDSSAPEDQELTLVGSPKELHRFNELKKQVLALPMEIQGLAHLGLMKVVDFQNVDYGRQYLEYLQSLVRIDTAKYKWEISAQGSKYLANAMAYDDIIFVADIKSRLSRSERILNEMNVDETQILEMTEFFHPRAEEITGLMPAKMGARWDKSPARTALLKKIFKNGRRLRSHKLGTFILLYCLGGLKCYRLKTHRHRIEIEHLEKWLETVIEVQKSDYFLAVELIKNRRLIKGYSDTHERSLSKFSKVSGMFEKLMGREDAAQWMSRLREAALQDHEGNALDGAIKTINSFTTK